MHTNNTMSRWWPKKMVGVVLVFLGVVVFDPPTSRAQMQYNGGYVQTHREDPPPALSLAAPRNGTRSPTNTPPSYFPDGDFYYSFYYPATTSVVRSYYAGGESERPISPPAARPSSGLSETALPWNRVGFKDYGDPRQDVRDSALFSPRKYSLEAIPLQGPPGGRSEAALLIAHLPTNAAFWVEGTRTNSTGRTRYFQSPPLLPGRKYRYTVRATWIEDGRWVNQTRRVLVQAGTREAIYLRSRNDSGK